MSDVYVHVWEFTVDDASRSDFEREYGPEGRWAALFRRAPGYLGTQLFRDESAPGRYLTIDRWQNAAAYRSFRSAFAEAYESLDRKFVPSPGAGPQFRSYSYESGQGCSVAVDE